MLQHLRKLILELAQEWSHHKLMISDLDKIIDAILRHLNDCAKTSQKSMIVNSLKELPFARTIYGEFITADCLCFDIEEEKPGT